MFWLKAIQRAFPNSNATYSRALESAAFEDALFKAGILENPRRVAAFFATVAVESGNMQLLRENLNYSKRQIENIFGVGKHSAGVTSADAALLANDPALLAERVYGLGNPYKAKELGNTVIGDGFKYRGLGPFQHTGKLKIQALMKRISADQPEELLHPHYLFMGAIDYWLTNGLNNAADMNDTRAVRKKVNGGYNGYSEFLKMYKQIYSDLTNGASPDQHSKMNLNVIDIQKMLVDLKYQIEVDGRYGEKTKAAVIDFQKRNDLVVDGIAGAVTAAKMRARLETKAPVTPPDLPIMTDESRRAAGVGGVSLGAASEILTSTARQITDLKLASPIFDLIPVVLILTGLAIMVWPIIKGSKSDG